MSVAEVETSPVPSAVVTEVRRGLADDARELVRRRGVMLAAMNG
jgi:hypothetical protein